MPVRDVVVTAGRRSPWCRVADDAWSVEQHHRVRREVFVEEQGLFHPDDLDPHDEDPSTIRSQDGREPAGAVRLFPLEPDGLRWQGDRLAGPPPSPQAPPSASPQTARSTAASLVAHIQVANVGSSSGWGGGDARERYVGVEHQPISTSDRRRPATGGRW
jgi:hypothetical protein